MVAGPLATSAKVFGGLNAAGLAISLAADTHVHLDLIGTGAFAAAAAATRGRTASTYMVGAWSARLAGFLFYRALTGGKDLRLEDTLSTAAGCASFWTVSFAWCWLTLLPHALGGADSKRGPWLRRGGAALFALGLATEVLADAQKFYFKRSGNKGFCDVGLWATSQHPNWFGNLALWTGVLVYNAPGMSLKRFAFAAVSPLALGALFAGQATGAMTPTVELAQKRYGADPRFAAYLRDVPLIVPSVFAWAAALVKGCVGIGWGK